MGNCNHKTMISGAECWLSQCDECGDNEFDILKAKNEALEKYAAHKPECDNDGWKVPCNCGLAALLEGKNEN